MIRAYDIGDGTVRFRSKFIRTTKFREEEAASRYKYATWSTRAPGGILRNLGGGRRRSQAEATVIVRHGKLLAFDEIGLPWSLDPHTLNTTSRYQIGAPSDRPAFKSRTKIDPITGDWLALGNDYVEPLKLRVLVENAQGLSKTELSLRLPRKSYFRDFFTTARFVVVGLNAVEINTLSATLGLAPILSAIRWKPSRSRPDHLHTLATSRLSSPKTVTIRSPSTRRHRGVFTRSTPTNPGTRSSPILSVMIHPSGSWEKIRPSVPSCAVW